AVLWGGRDGGAGPDRGHGDHGAGDRARARLRHLHLSRVRGAGAVPDHGDRAAGSARGAVRRNQGQEDLMGRARTIYGALAAVVLLAVGVPILVPSMATLVT